MNNYEIENLIKQKGKSIKNASNEMNIAYTTLIDILKRDITCAKLENVLLIANYLNTTVDTLLKNKKDAKKEMAKDEILNKINNFNNEDLKELSIIIDKIIKIKEN